jgi:paraquat-inducible protein B
MTETPPPPLKPASPVRNTASRAALAGISVVWLVPILALVVTLAIAWNAFSERGKVIEVEFADATGIVPGETTLRFREITVGRVESVSFTKDLSKVAVKIRVDRDVAPYIDKDANFWIVRPQVTAQGVQRLDTVLSGSFVEGYWDATVTELADQFVGLDRPPLIREDAKGTWIRLTADSADGVTEGAPVLFRGVQVGRMENIRLSESDDNVVADAFIEAPHDKRLTSSTVFWDTSGFSLSLGAQGVSFNVNSLSSLLQGGIAFDTLVSGGHPIEQQHLFAIQPDENTARTMLFSDDEENRLVLSMLVADSVQGLMKGADVQYRGIRVGRVTDLAVEIHQDAEAGQRVRQLVTISIAPSRMGLGPDITRDEALSYLQNAVQGGLRARVASAGLIGTSLLVELVDIADAEAAEIDMAAQPNPIIPSVEGDLSDFSASAQGLMERIGGLPIEEVLRSATKMMNSISDIAGSDDTRSIPEAARKTVEAAQQTVEDVRKMIGTVDTAAGHIGEIAGDLQAGGAGEKLNQMIEAAAAAAESVKLAAADVPQMVEQIDAAAAEVEEFGFAEISAQAEGILADLRAMLGSEDAEQLPRNLSNTLAAATGLLTDLRDGNAAGSLNNALDSASVAADEIAKSVRELPGLIQRLQATATRADAVLATYGDRSAFNSEAVNMLRELRRATEAFGSLARMIERNPRAFILGR